MLLSGVFSGSETGMYSLSRSRLAIEPAQGLPGARLVRWMARREAAILITVLIGNNLALEIATWRAEHALGGWGVGEGGRELVLAALLAPVVFLFGEVLPKDLFRRRPHALLRWTAPVIAICRYLFWPLERVLRGLSALVERAFGLKPEELARMPARAELLALIEEGARVGALEPRAERLARNALKLRGIPVARAMIPWREVEVLDEAMEESRLLALVRASAHTRLPVVGARGALRGYVHQLDVLSAGEGTPVLSHLRPIEVLGPRTPVDRALARLRKSGQRTAVVASAGAPLGLVTLKDLLEEISGDLGTW